MATSSPLQAASTQPATGVGSLAMTNQLIAQSQAKLSGTAPTTNAYTPAQVSQINTARQANVDAGVNAYTGAGATTASNAAGKGNIPVSNAPIAPPATSTNTPVSTAQPNPATVNATPYTGASDPSISAPQAQANLAAGGLTGNALASAQQSLSAYQQGHAAATASGVAAPQDAPTGMSAATTAAGNATQTYVPPAPVQDALTEATQKYTDDYTDAMSTAKQGETLTQQYQDLTKQLGIPALDTQLMNMKNVIDGTEDDIRNEVTKAGGFATDSQVLAMSNARNKVLIQNYNNLLQTKTDAEQQLTTLTGLAAQDRTYAQQQLNQQLDFDQKQIDFAQTAQTNAQQSYQSSAATFGWSGVLKQALATGDPTAVSRINATMGNGFDLETAAAAPPSLDDQLKSAEIAKDYSDIKSTNAASDLASIAPYANQTASGVKYVDASTIQGTAAQKNAIVNAAQANGYKVITNKDTALDLTNIQDAYSKLDTVSQALQGIDQPDFISRAAYGLGLTSLAVKAQSNPQQAASAVLSTIGTDILKAMQGVQGSRMSQAAVANINKELPSVYDTQATVDAKLTNLRALLGDRETAIIGSGNDNAPANTPAPQPLLTPTQIPSGMYQASDGLLYKK